MEQELKLINDKNALEVAPYYSPVKLGEELIIIKFAGDRSETVKVFPGFTDFVTKEEMRFNKLIDASQEDKDLLWLDLSEEPEIDLTLLISSIFFC